YVGTRVEAACVSRDTSGGQADGPRGKVEPVNGGKGQDAAAAAGDRAAKRDPSGGAQSAGGDGPGAVVKVDESAGASGARQRRSRQDQVAAAAVRDIDGRATGSQYQWAQDLGGG